MQTIATMRRKQKAYARNLKANTQIIFVMETELAIDLISAKEKQDD
jgi:hypothetical protein